MDSILEGLSLNESDKPVGDMSVKELETEAECIKASIKLWQKSNAGSTLITSKLTPLNKRLKEVNKELKIRKEDM